jgi:hypothetical protein
MPTINLFSTRQEKVHSLKEAKLAFFTKVHRMKDIIKARA